LSEISMLVTLRFNDSPGGDRIRVGELGGKLVSGLFMWGCGELDVFSQRVTAEDLKTR
jgi:hypothetical protein